MKNSLKLFAQIPERGTFTQLSVYYTFSPSPPQVGFGENREKSNREIVHVFLLCGQTVGINHSHVGAFIIKLSTEI